MPKARPQSDFFRVLELKRLGYTDREVSSATSVPVNTIRSWRRGRVSQATRNAMNGIPICDVCGKPEHDYDGLPSSLYAYLLGVYLGDGCLTPAAGSWSLRVVLDARYPRIIDEVCRAMAAFPGRPVNPHPSKRDRSVLLASSWPSWICLLPQHGVGRKHQRRIHLLTWQQTLVDQAPGSLLRGLIQTDGWRGVNRVVSKGKGYAYPRYQFSNRSDDIRKIFTDGCDALGIQWRQWTRYHISVAKRDSVALLDSFVGPKI